MTSLSNLPDSLPILTSGLGNAEKGKACAMSAVDWMEGGKGNSDMPECVHPVLRQAFIVVNDANIWVDDDHRTRTLWPLIARAMGTAPTGTYREQRELAIRLAIFNTKYVLPLVAAKQKSEYLKTTEVVQAWCDGEASGKQCELQRGFLVASIMSDLNGRLGDDVISAAFSLITAISNYKGFLVDTMFTVNTFVGVNAFYAFSAVLAQQISPSSTLDPVKFLIDLLDEYDRLTNRAPTAELDLRGLDNLVPVVSTL